MVDKSRQRLRGKDVCDCPQNQKLSIRLNLIGLDVVILLPVAVACAGGANMKWK
jgi:hypothetical protein